MENFPDTLNTHVAGLATGGRGSGITSEQSMRFLALWPVMASLAIAFRKLVIMSCWLSSESGKSEYISTAFYGIVLTNHGLPFASSPLVAGQGKV